MNAKPKISIVTPSYNQGEYLEQTIFSVRQQDYENVEHILIDGGSTDNTKEVIAKYQDHFGYWVSEPDSGHRYALQKGFAKATGDILAWQNSDDYYEPNIFRQVISVFQENSAIDVVFGNVRVISDDGSPLYDLRFVPAATWSAIFGHFPMHNQSAFFSRRVWEKAGGIGFDDYFFDRDLFIRILKAARRTRFVHRVLGNYRNHSGSGSFGPHFLDRREDTLAVRRRNLGSWDSMPEWIFRSLYLAAECRRTAYHAYLGDWDYLAYGILKRLGLRHQSACSSISTV